MKIERNLVRFGIFLAFIFWVVDSFIDSKLSSDGATFYENLLQPNAAEIWVRCFVILLFLIFAAYTERLLKIIDTMTRELEQYHDRLEYTITELQMEITERKHAIKELEELSETDPLTNLINRRKFHQLLAYEVERYQRYHSGLSLIMCDIDYFKDINDRFGHAAGDHALRSFSDMVVGNIREVDIVARWGGEEFMILMPNVALQNASSVAEKLRKAIAASTFTQAGPFTASFGVTHYSEHDTVESFIKRVDDALYSAKENGRNRVVTADTTQNTIKPAS